MTEQVKPTPGSWAVNGFDLTEVFAEVHNLPGSYRHICDCNYGHTNPDKHLELNKANAHLIASAPELLEACREAEKLIRNGGIVPIKGQTWGKLYQAIIKAEGKSTGGK